VRKMILFEKKTRVVGNGFLATGKDSNMIYKKKHKCIESFIGNLIK
jgi:hypothetical protein